MEGGIIGEQNIYVIIKTHNEYKKHLETYCMSYQDEIYYYAELISIFMNNHPVSDILNVARQRAKQQGVSVLYLLRIWESKAACNGFSIEGERRKL